MHETLHAAPRRTQAQNAPDPHPPTPDPPPPPPPPPTPSHILVPAIHRNRSEIRDLFRRTIAGPEIGDDPRELAEAARLYLRERFLLARVGISGANFGIADTGTVVVVESEGNGR